MAYIDYTVTSSSLTLWLAGLDGDWNKNGDKTDIDDGNRRVLWYLKGPYTEEYILKATATIYGSPSNNLVTAITITDLSPNTGYMVKAMVYWGNEHLTTLTIDVYTDAQSENPDEPWLLYTRELGTLTSVQTASTTLPRYYMLMLSVSFPYSGKATILIYSNETYIGDTDIVTPARDVKGWISTSSAWSAKYGEPTSGIITETDESSTSSSSSFSCYVTKNTTYYIWARCYYGDSESGYIRVKITPPDETSVLPWDWSISNGDATIKLTAAAYTAITNKDRVTDFSYKVWNDMVNKVVEILNATGHSWDSTYLSYTDTLMTDKDKTLTAVRFNSLRYNIGIRYSTGIDAVNKDDYVYGSYFVTLANRINSWIDTL